MRTSGSIGILGWLCSRTPKAHAEKPLAPPVNDEPRPSRVDPAEGSPLEVERLERAAERGDPVAQNSVGLTHTVGGGLLRSDEHALKWLRRAAEQGYAEAQFNLGNLHQSASLRSCPAGRGEARIEAYVWFHLAAAQGHAQAAAACQVMNLQLTDAELAEGNRRAHGFECKKEAPAHEID
ncbi:MAG: tetratricopeptide repeat protein [Verrucomicrobiia bacterium]